MDKEKLSRYKANKKEITVIQARLDKLYGRLGDVPVVQGKVSGSMGHFPYIETHMTVQMEEPKTADRIRQQIRDKEIRKRRIEAEIAEVDEFIGRLPDGVEKEIFEMVYLDGMSQRDAAEMLGYTQARVSQLVRDALKDL